MVGAALHVGGMWRSGVEHQSPPPPAGRAWPEGQAASQPSVPQWHPPWMANIQSHVMSACAVKLSGKPPGRREETWDPRGLQSWCPWSNLLEVCPGGVAGESALKPPACPHPWRQDRAAAKGPFLTLALITLYVPVALSTLPVTMMAGGGEGVILVWPCGQQLQTRC